MESKEPVFFIAQVMKNGGGQEKNLWKGQRSIKAAKKMLI